jgi:hypothetical protein
VTTPYLESLAAVGGAPPYTWRLAGGELPTGLMLAANGMITGTPSQGGVYSFTAQVTDSTGASAQSALTLTVIEPLAIASPSLLPVATVGQPYQTTITATGGTPPYSFSLKGGEENFLPTGLNLDSSGNLSGTPVVSAEYFTAIQVTDNASRTASMTLQLNVLTPTGEQGVRRLALSSHKDPVGVGLNYFYGDSDGQWGASSADTGSGQVNGLSIGFDSTSTFWNLQLSTVELGVPLTPGVYNNVQLAASAEPGHPGMNISGVGSECESISGSFTVLNAVFNVSGGVVTVVSFAARFEQFCNGDTSHSLSGTILYGVPPPALTAESPSITSASYKAGKATLTVKGKHITSQSTLVIDGHQFQLTQKSDEIGPAIKAVGVVLTAGTHSIQLGDVNGDLSAPFQLTVP